MFAGLTSTAAYANVFTFSFTGASDSGSGTFTANPNGTAGEYVITGMTGTVDGSAVMAVLGINSYPFAPFATNDNILFDPASVQAPNFTAGFLDINGVSFVLANGEDMNLYFGQYMTGDPETYDLIYGANATNDYLTSLTISPNLGTVTPEPSSLLLLGTGMLGLVGLGTMRRRQFSAPQQSA
jgi:hypothetical protein